MNSTNYLIGFYKKVTLEMGVLKFYSLTILLHIYIITKINVQ